LPLLRNLPEADAPRFARIFAIAAVYAALSVLLCARVFAVPDGVGWLDWDQHLFYYASVLKSVVEYGQPPFWNPWYCGGNVLWQNPQVALLSPAYPLALMVSLPLAMKINLVLHNVVGFAGMHLLLRRVVGLRSLPLTVFLATVYVGCGALALHLAEGHSVFLPALYLPLFVFWFCRAIEGGRLRDLLLAGATFALAVFNGGLHAAPLMAVSLAAFSLTAAVMLRRRRPLVAAIICAAASFAYAAPKLLPVEAFLESDRFFDERALQVRDAMSLDMVVRAYLGHDQTRRVRLPGQVYGWHEYGNYIGWPAAALIVAALVWLFIKPRPRGDWLPMAFAVTAVALFVLSIGEVGALSPATLARSVPLLSRFRIPSRYTIAFLLFAVGAAGIALREWSVDSLRSPSARWCLAVACILAIGDIAWQNGRHYAGAFGQPPLERGFTWLRRPGPPVQDAAIDPYRGDAPMLRALMSGRATFNCYESLRLVRVADAALPLISTEGSATATETAFTPNRIDVTVDAGPTPARLLVNQNAAPGWTSTLGPVGVDARYRNLSVALPAGTHGAYWVAFRPRGLAAGSLVFLLSVAASFALWKRSI
jgi:hypothetical protein